jgi:1-acyl-sn-glycerol-3-phosphate acyltransferase
MRATYRLPRKRRIGKVVHAFLMYYLVGIWFHLFFIVLYRHKGKLVVIGYERYREALERGRVVIVANHPAVIESYFLSVLLTDSFWWRIPEQWPYSFPDPASFLPKWLWWFFPLIRCVTVRRGNTREQRDALFRARRLLNEGETIVIHPEGGRTAKGKEFTTAENGRCLRIPLAEGVATLARDKTVLFLPVWVEPHGGLSRTTLSYREALHRGMSITVGEAFSIDPMLKRNEMMHIISDRILHAT